MSNTKTILLFLFVSLIFPISYSQVSFNPPEAVIDNILTNAVTIYIYNQEGKILGHGSGIIISDSGEVITNFHVVGEHSPGMIKVKSYFGGYHDVINFVALDRERDLALIKIEANKMPYSLLFNSDSIKIGQEIYVVGSPAGLENTISKGIISQIRKDGDELKLQFDAAISPGSSGGGIFDNSGRLIGITVEYLPIAADGRPNQNLNFGIPINYLRDLRNKKISNKEIAFPQKEKIWNNILKSLDNEINVKIMFEEGKYKIDENTIHHQFEVYWEKFYQFFKEESISRENLNETWFLFRDGKFEDVENIIKKSYNGELPDSLQFIFELTKSINSDNDTSSIQKLHKMFDNGLVVDLWIEEVISLWKKGFQNEMFICLDRFDDKYLETQTKSNQYLKDYNKPDRLLIWEM
jgi:hypothetical protein